MVSSEDCLRKRGAGLTAIPPLRCLLGSRATRLASVRALLAPRPVVIARPGLLPNVRALLGPSTSVGHLYLLSPLAVTTVDLPKRVRQVELPLVGLAVVTLRATGHSGTPVSELDA